MRFNETREISAVLLTDCVQRKFYIGMHPDDYESIWCKHGMMIDTVERFLLIFTSVQGHRSARN